MTPVTPALSPDTFVLRPIQATDEAAVQRLTIDTLAEFGYLEECPANDAELAHMAYYVSETPKARYYVVEDPNTKVIVGCGGFEPLKGFHGEQRICELMKFYVAKGFRRYGLGQRLMQQAIEDATDAGFDAMYYEVTPQLFSKGLFERHGFFFVDEKMGNNGHTHPEINIFVLKPLSKQPAAKVAPAPVMSPAPQPKEAPAMTTLPTPDVYPFLMIPGPTPLPDAVREVMSRPGIGHRSPEFKTIMKRVLPALKTIFKAEQSEVILYTASATGAIEGALQNVLNAGEDVLVLSCGVFSARWGDMAKSLGLKVTEIAVPHGQANTVASLKEALAADTAKAFKAVVLVHSETSTGALNPVKEMVAAIREHGALSIVDTVTGLTADAFDFDGWGVDLAISGSQKGFMMQPGLSFLAVSKKAMEAHAQVKNPGFYFNFKRNLKGQAEFSTAYTPATHLIMALDVALQLMLAEGLEAMNARHKRMQTLVRQGVRDLGLKVLVEDDAAASPAVTAVYPPEGKTVDEVRKALKSRFNLTVADGQAALKGKIFRIGHLGHTNERDVLMALACLKSVVG